MAWSSIVKIAINVDMPTPGPATWASRSIGIIFSRVIPALSTSVT